MLQKPRLNGLLNSNYHDSKNAKSLMKMNVMKKLVGLSFKKWDIIQRVSKHNKFEIKIKLI